MDESKLVLTFPGSTSRDKQVIVDDLIDYLSNFNLENQTEFKKSKESEDTQDAGTILNIILNSSAIASLATGVFNWLQKHREVSISISKGDTKIEAKNISSKDLESIKEIMNELAKNGD